MHADEIEVKLLQELFETDEHTGMLCAKRTEIRLEEDEALERD